MSEKQLSLYIHSPFCSHKCGYCDFNSWAEHNNKMHEAWLERVKQDIQTWRSLYTECNLTWNSVFFGGGTPSLLSNDILQSLGEFLRDAGVLSPKLKEFTIEVNPEDLTNEKLEVFENMGVSRLSIGIQSFQSKYLERLERQASVEGNKLALEKISKYWKGPWSLDLMYALPRQTLQEFENDLDEALSYSPKHLSLYQLTLSTARSKNWEQLDESEIAEFFTLKREKLLPLNFEHYEISNFAQNQNYSIHNRVYWELGEFLGVGPGAYGMLNPKGMNEKNSSQFSRFGFHQLAPSHFEKWLNRPKDFTLEIVEKRDHFIHLRELLLMGLRLDSGVQISRISRPVLEYLLSSTPLKTLLEQKNDYLKCTPKGFYILDTTVKNCFLELDRLYPSLDSSKIDPIFSK